ncbi:hypothetical protein BCR44DRAFT_44451, partial [Catenaria anguillulae PL171]
ASYYPTDYSVVQAAPLVRGDANNNTTVPLVELFPVFRSAEGISETTPIPITQLCEANPQDRGPSEAKQQPPAARESLALCMQDKCTDALTKVLSEGVTLDSVLRNSIEANGNDKDEQLLKYFNLVGAVQECAIKQCPLDYFTARSTLCISLRHPFFVKSKIQLPAVPASLDKNRVVPSKKFSLSSAWTFYQQAIQDDTKPIDPNSFRFRSSYDLGILLPTLPAGFPCDSSRADQKTGHLVPVSRVDATFYQFPARMRTAEGSLLLSTGRSADTALSRDAGDDTSIVTHPWMLKSTMLRGAQVGPVDDEVVRAGTAILPANLYSLGHCPASTELFTGSGLSGDKCKETIECVFATCVQGKCASAGDGKAIDIKTALTPVRDTPAKYYELKYRAEARQWTWIVLASLAGLVVMRVAVMKVQSWRAKRAGGK